MKELKLKRFNHGSIKLSREEKELYDVSLMTVGEALGHGASVDEKTLSMLLECAPSNRIKAFINHSNSPNVTSTCGYFFDLYISADGQQLKAKRFSFLDSFKKNHAGEVDAILELAEKFPEDWGISVSILCDYESVNGVNFIRPNEFLSADFVDDPAANPTGLFQRATADNDNIKNKKMKEKLELIKKRFGKSPELFTRAVSKFSENTDQDVEQMMDGIESEETSKSLEEANKKIAELESKIAELEGSKAKLETDSEVIKKENEQLKSKLEKLKLSGSTAHEVDDPKFDESGGDAPDVLDQYKKLKGSEKTIFFRKNEAALTQMAIG